MKELIDGEVIPREHEIERFDVAGLAALEELKSEAKRRDLWALGHPSEGVVAACLSWTSPC